MTNSKAARPAARSRAWISEHDLFSAPERAPRRRTSKRWLAIGVVALAIALPAVARALVENGALIYREDFEGEASSFGPFTPETDVLEGGSMSPSSVFSGPPPMIVGDVLRFALGYGGNPFGGDRRFLQEASVYFTSQTGGGPIVSALGERSFGVRGMFTDASFQELNYPGLINVTAGSVPGEGDSFFGLAGGLQVDLSIAGPPDMALIVGFGETSFPGLATVVDRSNSTPLSPAMRDAIVGGADFTVELLVDRAESQAWSSLQVEGFVDVLIGPLPIAELDRPLDQVQAEVAYAGEPGFVVSGPTVGLDAFEVRLPYSREFIVDRTIDRTDILPGNGVCATIFGNCTLRAAIQEANASPGLDRILFAEPQTLAVTRTGLIENNGATGDLDILDDLEILGLGVDQTIIDGNGTDRVFDIPAAEAATIVRIADVTIRGGQASVLPEFQGGGIQNAGRLMLERCRITDNQASVGGGLLNRFRLIVDGCLIDDNLAFGMYGFTKGGIGVLPNPGTGGPSITRIFDSAVVDNISAATEGGIGVEGPSELLVRNTTVSGNAAFQIVSEDADVTLEHVTLGGPAGLEILSTGPAVSLALSNTAIQGSCGASSAPAPSVAFGGENVGSDASCAFGVPGGITVAPLGLSPLLPMGDSRGHALLPASPLLDTADASGCPAQDQIGTPRPLDGDGDGMAGCDVGAIEVPEPGLAVGLLLGAGALTLVGRRPRAPKEGLARARS